MLGLRDGRVQAQAAGVDHPRVDRHGADALGEDVDDQRLGRVVGRLVAEPPLRGGRGSGTTGADSLARVSGSRSGDSPARSSGSSYVMVE